MLRRAADAAEHISVPLRIAAALRFRAWRHRALKISMKKSEEKKRWTG